MLSKNFEKILENFSKILKKNFMKLSVVLKKFTAP